MEQFAKIVNDTKLLTIFAKSSILDVRVVSEYASGLYTRIRQAHNNADSFYFQNRKNTISNVGVVEVMLWKKMNY